MAEVEAVLSPVCDVEDLLHELRLAFDLDTAIGVQLDAVGVRVGRSRYVRMPINTYFSWNAEKLGWNEGYWKGLYDPESGMTSLPDDLYRQLLYGKVAANSWDGTIPGAYAVWEVAFAGRGGILIIQDNQDMSMIVGIAGKVPDEGFIQLLLQGYIPLKPEGVRIAWFALPPGNAAQPDADDGADSPSEDMGQGNRLSVGTGTAADNITLTGQTFDTALIVVNNASSCDFLPSAGNISGEAIGKRYLVTFGILNTNARGDKLIPGTIDGTVVFNGVYS